MSRQLPSKPHLESLKKQAKQLLKARQAGAAEAIDRVEAVLQELPPAAVENFTLRDAQQVVAREYGFTSWQMLLQAVGQPKSGEAPPRTYVDPCEKMAQLLVEGMDGDVVLDLALPVVKGLMAARGSGADEREWLDYFAERIARDFEKTWAPIAPVEVRSFELETSRLALKLVPVYELCALLAFEANARPAEAGFTGLVSLCYPVAAISTFLPALGEYLTMDRP